MSRQLTMEDILNGVSSGGAQYVGNMGVIPLVAEEERFEEDEFGTVDDLEVGTSDYGTVNVRNSSDRTNFVPPGAGWVVQQAAQDHAVGGGKIIEGGSDSTISTARCIQSSQSGCITKGAHEMLVIPAELRGVALAKRKAHGYNLIWGEIGAFNANHGIGSAQELAIFVRTFKRQMDQFVAEFELLDNQIGAIVLMNGKVVGIELAPTVSYWKSVWYPLIRVCYGSLAKQCYRQTVEANANLIPDSLRAPLELKEKTIEGLREALLKSKEKMLTGAIEIVARLREHPLQLAGIEDSAAGFSLRTLGIQQSKLVPRLAGQVVSDSDGKIPFFSACAT